MNIIEMAREAGGALSCIAEPLEHPWKFSQTELERFAALARAEERKRTVEILMELHRKANGQHNYYHFAANEIQGFSV